MALQVRMVAFALFVLVAYPSYGFAIDSGCHPITDAERAALQAAGQEIPRNGQFCDKDRELFYSNCSEDPRTYLATTPGLNTKGADHVQGLNSDFACRLMRFIQASKAAGKKITLNSGYRSYEHQAQLYKAYLDRGKQGPPVAPPGRSRHNFGMAYDLLYDGVHANFKAGARNTEICVRTLPSCRWAFDNAGIYGLTYPMLTEPWHIEPGAGFKGFQMLPTDPGYWSSDSGTTYSGEPYLYNPTPTSGITDSLRNFLGLSSPPPGTPTPTTQPTQSQTQTQPQVCAPQFTCTGSVQYYRTSSCTTQVYQVCQQGCNGNACAIATSSTSQLLNTAFIGTSTAVANTNTNSNTNATPTPVSELLDRYINPVSFSAATVGTSTPLSLILTSGLGQISSTSAQGASSTLAPGTIQTYQPIGAQQTFISPDIAASPQYAGRYQAPATGFGAILANMQAVLRNIIRFLTPFSGAPAQRF